ncbi:hypothetical protein [Leifsonia sp. NPDC080035]|uniref:Peptidase S1 domain-containing protein n=1 Tax=Leifsonia sp. NPDC080035 TaxID=3143936 RepID=A0AAU7GFL2_9MICO
MRVHRNRVVAVIALAGIVSLAAVSPAVAAPRPDNVSLKGAGGGTCVEFDDDGVPEWFEDSTPELDRLANDLQDIANDNQDLVAGTAHCSHREAVAIFVTSNAKAISDQIEAVAVAHPESTVYQYIVKHSMTEMLAMMDKMPRQRMEALGIVGMHPDILTGGLTFVVRPGGGVSPGQSKKFSQEFDSVIGGDTPAGVSLEAEPADPAYHRYSDIPAYYMGGALCPTSGSCTSTTGGRCSGGIPLKVNGVFMMLTAGHCTASQYWNAGNTVGTQHTTAYPGNAKLYGDWKLLKGSSYGLRTFSGAATNDSSSLPITGVNWGSRSLGDSLCTSGSTTGQICRYFITAVNHVMPAKDISDGIERKYTTVMRHDNSNGKNSDNAGFRGGDSGGPCYYADGDGGVIVAGIVTATNTTTYYCTQLNGVRAWNSNTQLG